MLLICTKCLGTCYGHESHIGKIHQACPPRKKGSGEPRWPYKKGPVGRWSTMTDELRAKLLEKEQQHGRQRNSQP